MLAAEVAFWAAVSWIAYALVVYPAFCALGGLLVGRRVRKGDVTPSVSVIVSAYNEEAAIGEKIKQTLALDYPPDKLEVIVASDGSTDATEEIVRGYGDPRARLYRAEGRVGKTATLNGAVAEARGEILVFSDATGIFSHDAIRTLVSNFADPDVGCVAGRVAYRYGADTTSEGFRGYQRIVVAIRRAENSFGDQTSVSGSIHAMRRALFRPGRPGFSMDVIDAVHTVVQGRRVVYEVDAVSVEDSRTRHADEYRARVRIATRNTAMIPYILSQLAGGGRHLFLFQMISHKILRWWLWLPLVVAFVANAVLAAESLGYAAAFVLQLAVYGGAVVGLVAPHGLGRNRLMAMAAFFLLGNAAMCVGSLKALAGAQRPAWEPLR